MASDLARGGGLVRETKLTAAAPHPHANSSPPNFSTILTSNTACEQGS